MDDFIKDLFTCKSDVTTRTVLKNKSFVTTNACSASSYSEMLVNKPNFSTTLSAQSLSWITNSFLEQKKIIYIFQGDSSGLTKSKAWDN